MRAVDAHAVHALLKKIVDKGVVLSRFAGHGHHDRDAASRRGSQHRFGVSLRATAGRSQNRWVPACRTRLPAATSQSRSRISSTVSTAARTCDSARPSEDRPAADNCAWRATQIMASKRQIVQEIARAQLMMWMDVLQQIRRIVDEPQQVMSNLLELTDEAQECRCLVACVSRLCLSRCREADPRSIP